MRLVHFVVYIPCGSIWAVRMGFRIEYERIVLEFSILRKADGNTIRYSAIRIVGDNTEMYDLFVFDSQLNIDLPIYDT